MKRLRIFLFAVLLTVGNTVFATHQRAGEITFVHLSGLTYEFTIITYTYTPSPADRPELEISWGDGSTEVVERTNKVNLDNDISRNTYIAKHTFPSSGNYSISLEDPNRNAGIVNINNSVNIPFFIETTLLINPFIGGNSSPQLLNPPIDNGCTHKPYYHNPGAYDPDGDSLSYALVPCRGFNGENIPGYALPPAPNGIAIDPVTGDLYWDSPQMQGEYNIAILITEWRKGVPISTVTRDMQITIAACDNEPPEIITITDTCVVAGTTLVFDVTATDANSTQVTLSATGEPLQTTVSPALFPLQHDSPPLVTQFIWHTQCAHVRKPPYQVTFKAIDNGPQVNLVNFKTVRITVIAPAPENVTATPSGNNIHISWSPDYCSNVSGYKIYKRASSYNFEPDECETGLPDYAGYQLIGTTNNHNDTLFTDDGSVFPTLHGREYCYRIVAVFANGAESIVSEEACTSIINDAPMLTNVDVDITDSENGQIYLKWLNPSELDVSQYTDFKYIVLHSTSAHPNQFEPIDTTYSLQDTTSTHKYLNTKELTHYYKIELWGKADGIYQFVEVSDAASSVFIVIEKLDRALMLNWNENVPWINSSYTIYRYNELSHQFDSIGHTSEQNYIDENLQNGKEYCYFIRSKGNYSFTDTLSPYYNRSQQDCGTPADITPPEIPSATITTDCENVFLNWKFQTDTSYYDVHIYRIYYKPTYQDPFIVIDSIFDNTNDCYSANCTHILTQLPFITGCFAITAEDTAGNESQMSEITCFDIDQCMPYILPNVFTPDEDGVNDRFCPHPYTNVVEVNFTVYDRWGRRVFQTQDPDLNWNGYNSYTKQKCTDGVYYYVCEVYFQTLAGVIKKPMQGSITIITSK